MRNFQDAYKEALNELPRHRVSAENLIGGVPHDKAVRHTAAIWMRGAAVAVILVLCSAGTVTAVNYRRSLIRVEPQGYSLTSITEDQGGTVMGRQTTEEQSEETPEDVCVREVLEEQREYSSIEDFRDKERITMVFPELQWLGETDATWKIFVTGQGELVTAMLYGDDERVFSIRQWDVRGVLHYGAATCYEGTSANERSLTNRQGLSYVVFDSVEEQEIISSHAVISVNGREISMDFYGYDEEVIEKVLNDLDLNAYFVD